MQKKFRLTVVAACVIASTAIPAAASADGRHGGHNDGRSIAVIGDIPYGDAQIAAFPARIDELNADRDVRVVVHLGDIKSGSSLCTDEYFAWVRAQFDRIEDPLVYTPGDNEWTDCHRPNNGGYDPLERLDAIRGLFFDQPGRTLGQHPMRVASQADLGVPENVAWESSGISFAALHIVGSNNSLAPWTGNTTATPAQQVEVLGRTAADLQLIRDTFRSARRGSRAVALMIQADMFDPTVPNPAFADYFAFQPIVAAIVREALTFRGPVYLFDGDSHVANRDQPFAAGSPWLSFYGIDDAAPNVTRVTVEGSTGLDEWLKVTIQPRGPQVLTFERVPFVAGAAAPAAAVAPVATSAPADERPPTPIASHRPGPSVGGAGDALAGTAHPVAGDPMHHGSAVERRFTGR